MSGVESDVAWDPSHVVAEATYVWAAPHPAADVVAEMLEGTEVMVQQRLEEWAYAVDVDGWGGWVDARRLRVFPSRMLRAAASAKSARQAAWRRPVIAAVAAAAVVIGVTIRMSGG